MVPLAKPNESLIDHTENALKVFSSLKEAYSEVPSLCGVPQFWNNLFYAVLLHDLGKIARGFQEELKTGKKWGYRHEILSAGFVSALDISNVDKVAIGLSIITHHKDIQELREKYATFPEDNPGYRLYFEKLKELNLEESNKFLDRIPEFSSKYLGEKLNNYHYLYKYEDLVDVYAEYILPYYKDYRLGRFSLLHRNYGIFIKGFLTACDHLSSAGEVKIRKVVKDIKKYFNFKKFTSVQEESEKHKGNLFIISPTGSGKTEAALLWAHNNQNDNQSKRIFYILPYTASINYMYKRFVNMFGNDNLVGILHGKSSYFLYRLFSREIEDITYNKLRDRIKQYQSMAKKIYKPYKIVTPFQIIKAFFNIKGFEQSLSEMVGGLFIFDEIHSYDPHITALILEISKFIQGELNGKLLFMTATMPVFLKNIFQKELQFSDEISMKERELNRFTRHKLEIIQGNIIDNIELIKDEVVKGKKVLVVVNTVKRAQKIFKELRTLTSNIALLHSKFILRDREKIESTLKSRTILIGTQVIEVSLDIDYDVLFTEPAPIDALLQRFGRVNRRGKKGLAPVYIFSDGSGVGESKEEIYDFQRTIKSIEILKSINILRESEVQDIVNEVYKEGYSANELKIFRNVSESFHKFYRGNVPFIDKQRKESDFYSLFKSVEVVPYRFFNQYKNELDNKRYFEALEYFLPISLRQYHFLKKEDRLSELEHNIIIDANYDPELGLLLEENSPTDII